MAKSKRPKRTKSETVPTIGEEDAGERKFRLRPGSARTSTRGDIGWSIALRTVFRYARSSAKAQKTAFRTPASSRSRRAYNQRCAVRISYSQNKTPGQWRAHGIYIARESASGKRGAGGFDSQESTRDTASTLDRWQRDGDERIWKVILSPEFGERLDLEQMTREVMKRAERSLDTALEWVAVPHFNTEHPHVHLVIRGRRDDGSPLNLSRDFVKQGLRILAEEACTLQLGPRTELDAVAAADREVKERRYTSLDRAIERRAVPGYGGDGEVLRVTLKAGAAANSFATCDQHLHGRLIALQEMGLANRFDQQDWVVRKDFSTVLRAMQLAADRQKMLAANGALLSDPRLRLNLLDFRKTPEVQGRVLVHGQEESRSGADRHYLLLEGTDAQVHMIFYTPEMEQARNAGRLKPSSFVRFRRHHSSNRSGLEIRDFGDATALLCDKSFLTAQAQKLIRRGVIAKEEGWGGWLGQYQEALYRVAQTDRDPFENRRRER